MRPVLILTCLAGAAAFASGANAWNTFAGFHSRVQKRHDRIRKDRFRQVRHLYPDPLSTLLIK